MKFPRIPALLLTLCLLLLPLVSCMDPAPATENTSEQTSGEEVTTGVAEEAVSEYVIVRHHTVSTELRALATSLRNLLKNATAATVTLTTDDAAYAPAEKKVYILLGNTDYDLSVKAVAANESGKITYRAENNAVAIYAANDALITIGLEKFLSDCLVGGVLLPASAYAERQVAAADCLREGWGFSFPAYNSGTLDPAVYSAGYALSQNTDQSQMMVVNDTTAEEFRNYVSRLADFGYKAEFENEIDGNLFASCRSPLGTNVYAYYIRDIHKARVIHDVSSPSLAEFCYSVAPSENTTFYMYKMAEGSGSEDTFLVHVADNSWIVFDGGVTQYGETDPDGLFTDGLYEFMRSRSNLAEGEKLTISCWFNSHPHRDHFLAMTSLVTKYHAQIDLQRVLANAPDTAVVANSNYPQYRDCVSAIERYYPKILWLKAHTGMKIQIADVSFEVLSSQEDMIENWSAAVKSLPAKVYDINNSSLICKVDVAGLTVLELGDAFRCNYLLETHYQPATVACDILKVAHHYYNPDSDDYYQSLYATGKIQYALVNSLANGKSSTLATQLGNRFINADAAHVYGFRKLANGGIALEVIAAD